MLYEETGCNRNFFSELGFLPYAVLYSKSHYLCIIGVMINVRQLTFMRLTAPCYQKKLRSLRGFASLSSPAPVPRSRVLW